MIQEIYVGDFPTPRVRVVADELALDWLAAQGVHLESSAEREQAERRIAMGVRDQLRPLPANTLGASGWQSMRGGSGGSVRPAGPRPLARLAPAPTVGTRRPAAAARHLHA
jgi:hypothetical protein